MTSSLLSVLYLSHLSLQAPPSLPTCSSYTNQGFDCVPFYQCLDGFIITDGEGLIDPRTGLGAQNTERIVNSVLEEATCPRQGDVCCQDPEYVPTTPRPEPTLVTTCTPQRADTTAAWCHTNCFHNPPYCPASHCLCSTSPLTCIERVFSGACWRLCGPDCEAKGGNCPGQWTRC